MSEYQKINTLFYRDDNNIIIPDKFTLPEFEYLKNNVWECTEKIDGTNIRIEVEGKNIEFKGRTDKANIPVELLNYLKEKFTPEIVFPALGTTPEDGLVEVSNITIYGEGFGRKIQGCGGRYIKDGVDFILFDVKIGQWWLMRQDLEQIAKMLGCKIVPIVGYFTIPEAIKYVNNGFKSTISEDKSLDAEGLVLKTPNGLLRRNRERIITKIKTCDFRKFSQKFPNIDISKYYESK